MLTDEEVIARCASRASRFRAVFFGSVVVILLDLGAISAGLLDREGVGLYLAIGAVVAIGWVWGWFRRCPRCGYSFGRGWVISTCPACDAPLIPSSRQG